MMYLPDVFFFVFFFSSRRRHTRFDCDWSSDVCSSDLICFSSKNSRDPVDRFRGFYRIRAPMVSSTQQTQRIRQRKARAVGSRDRKSTRLNSSHSQISYAVFCLKKKNKISALHTSHVT